MGVDDFDPQQLEQLVAEALGTREPTSSEDSGAGTPASRGSSGFAFGDTQVFERLADLLPRYLQQPDVSQVIDELRGALYHGQARGNLRDLHTVVRHCRICPAVKPDPQLPTWNLTDPDVVFVADTPWSGSKGDQYLATALRDAGFSSKRICYTSTVRCFPAEQRPPSDEEITVCSSRYLFTELELLAPKLIVALGGIPATTLLSAPVKITEERGRIVWLGPWPVLITYSPAYVMKREREQDFAADLAKGYSFVHG